LSRKVREIRNSGGLQGHEGGRGPPTFGRPGSVVGPQRPPGHCSPASHPTPHAPRRLSSGVRSCAHPFPLATARHRQPNWQRPNGARPDDRPLISMSPNRAIRSDISNFSSINVAARPSTILSWLGALNASCTRHVCRMASGWNARSPCLEALRLFSIVLQVETLAPSPSLLTPRSSMVGRPLSTDDG